MQYGLRILFRDIEDSPHNETRFAVIGHAGVRQDRATTRRRSCSGSRTAPARWSDALNIFKQNKINLTWIESFPSQSAKPEYVFFVDFEGHQDDPKVKKTLGALQGQAEKLYVLGSFPIAQLSE